MCFKTMIRILFVLIFSSVLFSGSVFGQNAKPVPAKKEKAIRAEIKKLEDELSSSETASDKKHAIERKLAERYQAVGDSDSAISHMRSSIDLQENPPVGDYLALGSLLIDLEKHEAAIDLLGEAQEKFPDSLEVAFLLTHPLSETERWKAATEQFAKMEKLSEKKGGLNDVFYFRYGASAERSGDIDKAAQLFQTSLEKIPRTPDKNELRATVLNYLGYMWVEKDKNLDVAGELIKKAAKLDPNSGAIADSLGWYYFKKKRYIEAMSELEKAESLMEKDDAVVMDHIAQTYYQIGNKEEAQSYMKRAVKIDPENKEFQDRLKEYGAN